MTELDGASRALIDAARDGLGPDDAAVARMRGRIAAVAAGTAVAGTAGSAAAATATTAATAAAGVSAVKIAVVVAAIVIAAGGGVAAIATWVGAQPQLQPIPQPTPTLAPTPTPIPTPTPQPTPTPTPTPIPAPQLQPPPPPTPPPTLQPTPPPPPKSRPLAPAPPPSLLHREVELVDTATRALRAGRYHDALATVAAYTREVGSAGQLAEDAAAIEVEAHCDRRDAAAAGARASFDTRYPHSIRRARLDSACAPRE